MGVSSEREQQRTGVSSEREQQRTGVSSEREQQRTGVSKTNLVGVRFPRGHPILSLPPGQRAARVRELVDLAINLEGRLAGIEEKLDKLLINGIQVQSKSEPEPEPKKTKEVCIQDFFDF